VSGHVPSSPPSPLRSAALSVGEVLDLLEALDGATRGIAGVLSLDRVLQLVVDRVRDLVQAEYAALGIADAHGNLERFVTGGISREERERIGSLPRGHGLLGILIREAATVRIPEISADPRSYGFPPQHPQMHTFLGVPITVRGRVVGDLYLTDKRGAPEFSEADQAIVEMFAGHAGIAIENARLHEEVERLAVVEERERIGQDLHDSIIQSLYALSLALEEVPDLMAEDALAARARVDHAIDGLHLAIRDIRNFIFGLRPERLGQVGLVGGLATVVDEYRLNTMVDIELSADEGGLEPAPDVTIQLVNIAQEALSNTARHARATRARVSLDTHAGAATDAGHELVLEIADNGIGFDPDEARSEDHRGVRNMRARAASLGGRLEILSGPDAGTRIIVRVPSPRDT
jgi:two-component system, NarL family, sensor histidine kinase DevS